MQFLRHIWGLLKGLFKTTKAKTRLAPDKPSSEDVQKKKATRRVKRPHNLKAPARFDKDKLDDVMGYHTRELHSDSKVINATTLEVSDPTWVHDDDEIVPTVGPTRKITTRVIKSTDKDDVVHVSFNNNKHITRRIKRVDPVTRRVSRVKMDKRTTTFYKRDGKLYE